ncbi:putative cytochrome p450 monooxygenase lova [Fusarium sporotrichioides]|uniref:Putative cytochrome p450 monooxygenase lova n=1 Tax=Fusarium sporotrichioides TaxID=5514 RepID=A0A395RQH9_FUSSP|nr:putative cytochrome p450 monooxygenase lova [Fusarium sporotrichioides]
MATDLDLVLGKSQYALFCGITLFSFFILKYSLLDGSGKKYPFINPKKPFEFSNQRVVQDFIENAKDILTKGRSLYKGKPYKAHTDLGDVLVIPPEYVDTLKSERKLDFSEVGKDDTHGYIPGFEPIGSPFDLVPLVNKYLTRALAKLTKPLWAEASLGVDHVLGNSTEWHPINPGQEIMRIVSRMSSRVFMGEELCKDDDWLKVSIEYTVQLFQTADVLRNYPRWARPYVHWFMPSCQGVRRKLQEARDLLQPHIERRNAAKQEAIAEGRPSPFDDSIEWFEKEYDGKSDPATEQIKLSLVAIHTTTDLLLETMFNIATHPELLGPLREELVTVLRAEGLKKTSLYNLKLMDSVIKESQRLRPVGLGLFRRRALADITLPNGDVIKKGTKILCDTTHQWNSEYYPDASKFDGYRFLRMRQTPGQDKHAHLVSTSHDQMGFGHGIHACPGRFFAANEIKIALCHMLIKYDWKMPEGVVPKSKALGMTLLGDREAKLMVKRRETEIDIDAIESNE